MINHGYSEPKMTYFSFFRRSESQKYAKDVLGEFESYQKSNPSEFTEWIVDNRCHSE
jgi:hypothetical protein